jgi:U3 small nucleolar RNA-associated protein 4
MKCFAFKGVDPLIVSFAKICLQGAADTSRSKWVKSVQRRIHDHDVRALALADGKLISAGWNEVYRFQNNYICFC